MSYFIWIPLVFIFYFIYGWLSYKNSSTANNLWFWVIYLYGAIFQLWAFVSKFSKNIVLDALVYDLVMAISLYCALLFFKNTMPTIPQIIGIVLCIVGLLLIR